MKREALSRGRILRAALAIVDREGLEAISMRRVGEALGVEAMSLYNHVANKGALLDGIFELVVGELGPSPGARPWKEALRERGEALRAALRRHPNAIPLFASRPAVTPASIAYVEEVLGVLRDAGLDPNDALATLQTMVAYVVGHSVTSYGKAGTDATFPRYEALDAAAFPRIHELAAILPTLDAASVEAEFFFGLDTMLDGLERRIDGAGKSPSKITRGRGG